MNIRRFKVLHEAGASYAEIAREVGCDWRTVRRYLAEDAPTHPPRGTSRAGTQPRTITDEIAALIEDMLRADVDLPASVAPTSPTTSPGARVRLTPFSDPRWAPG